MESLNCTEFQTGIDLKNIPKRRKLEKLENCAQPNFVSDKAA